LQTTKRFVLGISLVNTEEKETAAMAEQQFDKKADEKIEFTTSKEVTV